MDYAIILTSKLANFVFYALKNKSEQRNKNEQQQQQQQRRVSRLQFPPTGFSHTSALLILLLCLSILCTYAGIKSKLRDLMRLLLSSFIT